MTPLISICIPAYKRTDYLKRLLDSIVMQSFKDFEVVITDDSNDNSVSQLLGQFKNKCTIIYQKNTTALGSPENWNEAVRIASGNWIKIMHDDDWFENADALEKFASATADGRNFIFSAYRNRYEDPPSSETVRASAIDRQLIKDNPCNLVARNLVGPPSVTLYRKTALQYDKRMKWRVDIDFYIQYLAGSEFSYIDEPLVNIGISREQVTQSCFLVPEVEVPENMLLLQKIGLHELRRWRVYDTWWRLFRNLNFRSLKQIRDAGYQGEIPLVIQRMISEQSKIPHLFLKTGLLSKLFMFLSLFRWKYFSAGNKQPFEKL